MSIVPVVPSAAGCPICRHEQRQDIEAAGQQVRDSMRELASQYNVPLSDLADHLKGHEQRSAAQRIQRTLSVLDEMVAEVGVAKPTKDQVSSAYRRLPILREMVRACKLLADMNGEIKKGVTVNVMQGFIQQHGLKDEKELKHAVEKYLDEREMPLEEKVLFCETFLADTYKRHPELRKISPLFERSA